MEEQEAKQQSPRYLRSIIHFLQGVACTLLVFGLLFTIYLIVIYQIRLTPHVSYAVVFDAGSSHSEMFVYHWPADKSEGLGTTSSVNELFVCPLSAINASDPNKPDGNIVLKAISDFDQKLDLLSDYFRPCLSQAIAKIPAHRHKFSPIFLGATAGMRLVRLHNLTRSNQILETIREIFANSPFQFVISRQVRILSGMEEAIDGWITTNLLLEKFKHRHARKKQAKRTAPSNKLDSDMVGVLDLGGASTQVTFTYPRTLDTEPIPANFTTNMTLFDTMYSPYAHSYLCWGKNEAWKRHRARLVNAAINPNRTGPSNATRLLIRDPCLARGTNATVLTAVIFHSPCVANEKQRFNKNINALSFTFVGAGNATQCRQSLISLFDSKRTDTAANCSYKQEYCTFDHTFQPKIPDNLHFIGLSGYYYVFSNLAHGMNKPNAASMERYRIKDFPEQEIEQRLISVCQNNYSTLYIQESMTPKNEPHKRNLCFDAWYMWLLLTHAIGFKKSDLQRLSFVNTFPTGKVGWTLGYMINQTNYIPAEYRERLLTKSSFIGWLSGSLVITLITIIFLLFTCLACYQRRKQSINCNANDDYGRPNDQSLA